MSALAVSCFLGLSGYYPILQNVLDRKNPNNNKEGDGPNESISVKQAVVWATLLVVTNEQLGQTERRSKRLGHSPVGNTRQETN